jgi:hypothetical protein
VKLFPQSPASARQPIVGRHQNVRAQPFCRGNMDRIRRSKPMGHDFSGPPMLRVIQG